MRVNIIDPMYLTDNHLIAEYREMKMVTAYYLRSSKTKTGIDKSRISPKYTLNQGHAYMWFNKMNYIRSRFYDIVKEMKSRGFATNFDKLNFTNIPTDAFGDYTVTQEDVRINLDRILIRLEKQPHWYKYNKSQVQDWVSFYETLYNEGKLVHNLNKI